MICVILNNLKIYTKRDEPELVNFPADITLVRLTGIQ